MSRTAALLFTVAWAIGVNVLNAQEPAVIKVRRESNLSKAVFDNTTDKLVVVDRFGNPRENAVLSYTLYVKDKSGTTAFEGYGNNLTLDMKKHLRKQKSAVKLFFTGIVAKEDDGHTVKLPDVIEPWFPDCKNCDGRSRK